MDCLIPLKRTAKTVNEDGNVTVDEMDNVNVKIKYCSS